MIRYVQHHQSITLNAVSPSINFWCKAHWISIWCGECLSLSVGYGRGIWSMQLNNPRRMTHFPVRASCAHYFGTIKYYSLIYRTRTECFPHVCIYNNNISVLYTIIDVVVCYMTRCVISFCVRLPLLLLYQRVNRSTCIECVLYLYCIY